jgi:transposase InsO family protein
MPGQRITDKQMNRYKELRRKLTQEVAAAKVGISLRTARRIEQSAALPSQRPVRSWRTRTDPLASVWDSEIVPLLHRAPGLNAVTLLEEMQRRYPERFGLNVLRTMQRRLRRWRALEGEEREVFFAQAHEPGRLGLSDFTDAAELEVTLDGIPFAHRLYQFALAYCGWRHVEVILGGESWVALSGGLQNALWSLGGAPLEHRTDSLSAAFNNLAEQEELTRRYDELSERYGMRATRNNPGASHENGSIESRQGTVKRAIEQALLLRGSRDFTRLSEYRSFIAEVAARLNSRVIKALTIERACLQALPQRRTSDYEELDARVTKFALIAVKSVTYSVPSRLVGHRLKIRLYEDRIEGYLGEHCVMEAPRLRRTSEVPHPRYINFRHLLPALKRKPGALVRWRLRDALFPRSEYAMTWERLIERLPEGRAARLMVALLELAAADGCEVELAFELAALAGRDELPDLETLTARFRPRTALLPNVSVHLPELALYDALVEAA